MQIEQTQHYQQEKNSLSMLTKSRVEMDLKENLAP